MSLGTLLQNTNKEKLIALVFLLIFQIMFLGFFFFKVFVYLFIGCSMQHVGS